MTVANPTIETELVAYSAPESTSARLHQRALRVMPGGNTRTTVHRDPYPPYAAKGYGQTIVDVEGQERIDFLNNYTSLIHGHAHPDVVAAVVDQVHRGSSFGLPTRHEVDLAELLVDRIASVDQVRFTNSGTEAVMMALQAARAYTGRPMIAKFEGAYHGAYDFAAVSTSIPAGQAGDAEPAATPHAVGTPDAVVDGVAVARYNDIEGLERVVARHKDRLAAVLVDLMPWRMGLIAAEEPFVHALRDMTRAHGILLIVDEVITLRVAPGGAQALYGVTPDLTTMGKVIGGGFPVGAVGGRAEVMAVFDPRGGQQKVPHGGTFTANPVTMAAGLATMRKLTPDAYRRLDEHGAELRDGLAAALDEAGIAGQVTGKGSLFGICFGEEPARDFRGWSGTETERAWRGAVYAALLGRGSVVAPHLVGCLSTPMTHADTDTLVANVRFALRALKAS